MEKNYLNSVAFCNSKNIVTWDPFYNEVINYEKLMKFCIYSNNLYIVGPIKVFEKIWMWLFELSENRNGEYYLRTEWLVLRINNGIGEILSIEESEDYSEYYVILWAIEIFRKLGCKRAIILDARVIDGCVIRKLSEGRSFLEEFGFMGYNEEIDRSYGKLLGIKWDEMEFESGKNRNIYWEYRERYGDNYRGPFLAFMNYKRKDERYYMDFMGACFGEKRLFFREELEKMRDIYSKIWILDL